MDLADQRKVLEGNFSAVQYRPLSRSIRIYLSSEYTDTIFERGAVRNHVFPKLRSHCQSIGFHFCGLDLFDSTSLTLIPQHQEEGKELHNIYRLEQGGVFELAVREVKLCQQLSSGPAFLTLLGQRYGHKLLHPHIHQGDFDLLLAAIEESSAKQLVEVWYKLDTNATPPQYVLLPYNQKRVGMEEWVTIHGSLSKTLRKAARVALGKDVHKVQRFIMSAVEEEITHGVFDCVDNPNHTCFWFKRVFTDLFEQRTSDPSLPTYSDTTTGKRGMEFDSENLKMLNQLKEARLPAKYIGLDSSNIFESLVRWQKGKGLNPADNSDHELYLKKMHETMVEAITEKLTAVCEAVEEEERNKTYLEVLHHSMYCRKKIQTFMDRPALINAVYRYFSNSSNSTPYVVHGKVGSGKTFLMAGAAHMLQEKFPLQKKVLVVRFIGHTPQSHTIRNTLRSICEQLSVVFKKDSSLIPGGFNSLVGYFKTLLCCASADRPVYVLLDGVDQLSPEDGAYGMAWLPSTLPPHVKIVLSTSSEVQYHCYPVLRSLLANHKENLLQIPLLDKEECRALLTHQLHQRGRRLTRDQETAAMIVLLKCPAPLYMDLLLIEMQDWKSFQESMPWRKTPPPTTIRDITKKYFQSLESEFGILIISHLASYISSAKHGLTEMELLDLMSADSQMMCEVNKKWRRRAAAQTAGEAGEDSPSQLQSFPSLLWSQMYHRLVHFLGCGVGAGGYCVLRWRHRHTAEFVASRYLTPSKKMESTAGILADYYIKTKPYQNEELGGESRRESSDWTTDVFLDAGRTKYNIRKLLELPYCLQRSGRTAELRELLFSYIWLKGKLNSLSCSEVIEDFSAVCPVVPLNRSEGDGESLYELRLLRNALTLSMESFNADPASFPQQLCGRLLPFIGDDFTRPLLKKLIQAAMEDCCAPLLMPFKSLEHLPGGPLLVTMNGHRAAISGVCAAPVMRGDSGKSTLCIVTSSWDKTLKSWNLESGGVLKTFDGHADKVLSVSMTADGQYIASGSADTTVRFWCVSDARCLHVLQGHSAEVNSVVLTSDGTRTISASTDCSIKVWNTDSTSSSCGELIYTMDSHGKAIQTTTLSHNRVLASGDKAGLIMVTDIISGGILCKLKGRGAITALSTAEIDNVRCLLIGTETGQSVVKELLTGKSIQKFMWNAGDRSAITAIAAAPDGKVVISNKAKQLSVWHLHDGHLMYSFAGHQDILLALTVTDHGHLVLTGCRNSSLQIWDLLSPPVTQSMQHSSGDTSVRLSPCGAYGVSGGEDSILKVYDTKTMGVVRELDCRTGKPITQVLVLRDSKHIIAAFGDGSMQYWNGMNEELVMSFSGNSPAPVTCVDVSPDSELIMSGSEDSTLSFWSIRTGEKLKTFTNHSAPIIAVAFCQNQMLTASRDGRVYIRCFRTAKVTETMSILTGNLLCLSVSPNGKFFVAGSQDAACHVVDMKAGLLKKAIVGHKGPVTSVQVLSDFNQCLTACEDGYIRIWDLENGSCISSLRIDSRVTSCCANLQNNCLIYGTISGWVSSALYLTQTGSERLQFGNSLLTGLPSSLTSISGSDSTDSTDSKHALIV